MSTISLPSPTPEELVVGLVDGSLHSGRFYASAQNTISGPLFDQADILADFADETIQDHAYAAIHRFLPAEEEAHS